VKHASSINSISVEKQDLLHTVEEANEKKIDTDENSIEGTLNALKVVWMGLLLLKK
jgi:hypothetical protein